MRTLVLHDFRTGSHTFPAYEMNWDAIAALASAYPELPLCAVSATHWAVTDGNDGPRWLGYELWIRQDPGGWQNIDVMTDRSAYRALRAGDIPHSGSLTVVTRVTTDLTPCFDRFVPVYQTRYRYQNDRRVWLANRALGREPEAPGILIWTPEAPLPSGVTWVAHTVPGDDRLVLGR